MNLTVERLRDSDYEELLDFIDLVFSQHSRPHHFHNDLPLLFEPTDASMRNQYVLREHGRIRAAIGVIPYIYCVGDARFRTCTITNVATHHQHTGKGCMQRLLAAAIADMKADGVAFATLHGNRERYRYWGFDSAGVVHQAVFTRENALHRMRREPLRTYRFTELQDDDQEHIALCLERFNQEPQRYLRPPETFMKTMRMWHATPYRIHDAEDRFCGYLNFGSYWGGRHIQELLLADDRETADVVAAFLQHLDLPDVVLSISPFHPVMFESAYSSCESRHSGEMCRVAIYRLDELLAACLNAKQRALGSLPQGELVLESVYGRHRIRNDGGFTVTTTDQTPDLSVEGTTVNAFLFGPSESVIPYDRQKLGALGNWLPAPLFIHAVDRY